MKHAKSLVVTAGVALAFVAGHLMAQPDMKPNQAAKPIDHEREAFIGDLGAAIKHNNHAKVIRLLDEAAGDAKFTEAIVLRTWDMAYNADAKGDRREVLAATFAMKQRQREIELLEGILAELKKSNKPK